jgi:hypothetical protein
VAGALAILLGAPAAIAAASADNAPGIIIHFALGISFVLLARSAHDFGFPRWLAMLASGAIGVFAIVFLLQGIADLLHSARLRHMAYAVLGQRLERVLGYAFLAWCILLWLMASAGKTKVLGAAVLAVIASIELYGFTLTLSGSQPPEALKVFYLPLFVWLLLEGMKPSEVQAAS